MKKEITPTTALEPRKIEDGSVLRSPMHTVYALRWEESDSGWGSRQDGYSLHLTIEDTKIYVKEYWESMSSTAPPEYARPLNATYMCSISDERFAAVKSSKNGVRYYDRSKILEIEKLRLIPTP